MCVCRHDVQQMCVESIPGCISTGRFGFNVADLHDSSLLVSHLTNSMNLVHATAYSCQELAIYEETALAVVAHYRDTPFVSVPFKKGQNPPVNTLK